MANLYIRYPSAASGGGGLSSISFSIGTFDSQTPNANGASVSSSTIYLQASTATLPGLVSSNAQTFAGVKTFSSAPNLSSLTPSLPLQLDGSRNVVSQAVDLSTSQVIGSISLTNQVSGALPFSSVSGSVSLVNQVVGNLPIAQTSGSVSLVNKVVGNLPLSQTSGSVSLTAQVSGNLPLSQTQGSISLTTQVSGVLPAANLPLISGISGSVSLTTQVSGILPAANGGSTGSNTGDVSVATFGSSANSSGASMAAGQVLTLQPASSAQPGGVSTGTQEFGGAKTFISTRTTTGTLGSVSVTSSAIGAAYTITLPGAQGAASSVMSNDGAGNLSWVPIGTTISNTSSIKTAGATDNWHSMASNSLCLTQGTWMISGSARFGNSGSTPTYTDASLNWFSANGGDSNTVPTILNSCSGLTVLSAFYNGVFNGTSQSGSNAGMPGGLTVGTGADSLVGQTVVVKVVGTSIVYLVTYSTETTAGNTRIGTYTTGTRIA